MTTLPYFSYWGKADGDRLHLLPYHCLDVAAAGKVLLDRNRPLLDFFVVNSGLDQETFVATTLFFLAMHDAGKFSNAFQGLREDLLLLLAGRKKSRIYDMRHDSMGFLLWQHSLEKSFKPCMCMADRMDEFDDLMDLLQIWALAFSGHHGQPPKACNRPASRYFLPEDIKAAEAFSSFCQDLFLADVSFAAKESLSALIRPTKCLSWWLAGLAVLCDWLGSNNEFFHPRSESMNLLEYWHEMALPAAARIVQAADLLPVPTKAAASSISDLFPGIEKPTPLQKTVEHVPLGDGPSLFILEDVTGAGKTEAAFMLLHRLMADGKADGAYLALPTMATANAMYARTRQVYRRLYAERQMPSLVLAHGSRHLVDGFAESVLPFGPAERPDSASSESAASCAAWLADNRKKALLAHMGVGTIDQVLMAVLRSKHQSLRLLGLRGKTLIVDEVHACDAYMHRLLQTLLAFHAAAGGSAILLSATLPKAMRTELLSAYAAGMGCSGPIPAEEGYPLLSVLNGEMLREQRVGTRDEVRRTLSFSFFDSEQTALDLVLEKARSGQCVAWVRNTVADAMKSWERIKEILSPEDVLLFHARFALGDRLEAEERVLSAFGKQGGMASRQGKVLIATQVVEQSLDLDFDWMVSDLAPVDLLLQRAGRLRRHSRARDGSLTAGTDQRGEPTLHVLAPAPRDDADERWLGSLLPNAVMVYEDFGRLWLTARFLSAQKQMRIPEDLRTAIEYVYGEGSDDRIPEGLQRQGRKTMADAMAESSLARMNSIRFESGYSMTDHEWWDESFVPTRLGEPSSSILLARWQEGSLRPWFAAEKNAWPLSEVSVRRRLAAKEADLRNKELEAAVASLKEQWSRWQSFSILVPLQQAGDGSWQGHVVDEQGREVSVSYSAEAGLAFKRQP